MTNFQTRWHVTEPDTEPVVPPNNWWSSCSSKPESAIVNGIRAYKVQSTSQPKDIFAEAEDPDSGITQRWRVQIRPEGTAVFVMNDGKYEENDELTKKFSDSINQHRKIIAGGSTIYSGGVYTARQQNRDPFESDWHW